VKSQKGGFWLFDLVATAVHPPWGVGIATGLCGIGRTPSLVTLADCHSVSRVSLWLREGIRVELSTPEDTLGPIDVNRSRC